LCARKKELGQPRRRPDLAAYRSQFSIGRFTEVARIWKAIADRCKAFEGDASSSANGEGVATIIVIISSDEEE
jgi:hypothetical protein